MSINVQEVSILFPHNISHGIWLEVSERLSHLIQFSTLSHMKCGRNETYSKMINDLETVLLRLQRIRSTNDVQKMDRLLEDLRKITGPLNTAMHDEFMTSYFILNPPCHVLAINLMDLSGVLNTRTYVQQIRVFMSSAEWGFQLDTCYERQVQDVLEQIIQSEPSPVDPCCSKEEFEQRLSVTPPVMLDADHRKKEYFPSSDSEVPCPKANLFYEKFYRLFVKSAVLWVREGANATCNEIRDGLESLSTHVLQMADAHDVSELQKPWNDLIRLEKKFESVLDTIDIRKYKPIFDKWEKKKKNPEIKPQPQSCKQCEPYKKFSKNFQEKSNDQKEFIRAVLEFFTEKSSKQ